MQLAIKRTKKNNNLRNIRIASCSFSGIAYQKPVGFLWNQCTKRATKVSRAGNLTSSEKRRVTNLDYYYQDLTNVDFDSRRNNLETESQSALNYFDQLDFNSQFQTVNSNSPNMSHKQNSEVDLGEFAESDLSPEMLAAALTNADVDDLLLNTSYQQSLDTKWSAPQVIEEPFSLSHDEVSFEIGTFDDSALFSTNCESNDFTLLTNSTRPTALACQPATTKYQYVTPSVLVSPASECSTAVEAATPMLRRRRRNSSCSSESASLASEASGLTSAATPAPARGGAKRRRGAGRSATVDKDSEEYKRRRVRNNVAVRKSRDKAKQKQEETTRKVSEMARENESLTRQLETVTQELTLLRSIFSNLGVPIQQLVTNALSTATQNLPRTGNAAARAATK